MKTLIIYVKGFDYGLSPQLAGPNILTLRGCAAQTVILPGLSTTTVSNLSCVGQSPNPKREVRPSNNIR